MGETHRLFDADAPAAFAPTGHLLFMSQGTLFAQTFDPVGLKLKGNPFSVIERAGSLVALSTSAAGPVVYRVQAPGDDQRQFVWIDRSGTETGKVVFADTAGTGPSLDQPMSAVWRSALYKEGNMDIWSYEDPRAGHGTALRLTRAMTLPPSGLRMAAVSHSVRIELAAL